MSKLEYKPKSHFFTEHGSLQNADPVNKATDAFGPVQGNEATKFRVTSKVRSTAPNTKVFAISDGHVLIQPNYSDTSKVNLIVKNADAAAFAPLKIKYFIYRGVNKSDIIAGTVLQPVNNSDPLQPDFLKTMWYHFLNFNMHFYTIGVNPTPPSVFPAPLIGYDTSQQPDDSLIDLYFFKEQHTPGNFYQLPKCKKGQYIGNFSGTLGLDIILDRGDYQADLENSAFRFDLAYARKGEQVFDLAGVPAADQKKYREHILQFMDAAAFWGSHITCGEVTLHNDATPKTTAADIYTNIVQKFQTRNQVYLYITAERGRSYNFYGTIPLNEVNFELNPVSPPPAGAPLEPYVTNGWPVLIKSFPQATATPVARLKFSAAISIDGSVAREDMSVSYYTIIPNHPDDNFRTDAQLRTFPTHSMGQTKSLEGIALQNFTTGASSVSIASFAWIFFNGVQPATNNPFDDLWFANHKPAFETPATGIPNLCSWLVSNNSRVLNLAYGNGLAAALINNKIVFDTGKNSAAATKKRRLYIAALADIPVNLRDDNSKLIAKPMTSGFEKNLTKDNYSLSLYNDPDFDVYKSTITDGATTVATVSLMHRNDYQLGYTYFQLGITEEEYNKLVFNNPVAPPIPPGLPYFGLDASNITLHLQEDATVPAAAGFRKFELGLKHENGVGVPTILYPTAANKVYVYTVDGFYFFSKEYADYQEFFESYPKCNVKFRNKLPYNGEYGFDWMRIADTTAPGDVAYRGIMGKQYTSAAFTTVVSDINASNGFFNVIPSMYRKLEFEYKPFVANYKAAPQFEKYHTPVVALYPPYVAPAAGAIDLDMQAAFPAPVDLTLHRKAVLSVKIEVIAEPVKLEFAYDATLFSITPTVLTKTVGTHTINITITALKEFGTEQQIAVKAFYNTPAGVLGKGQMVGVLRVNPNAKVVRRQKRVLMILMKTNIGGGTNTAVISNKAVLLKKYLRQALISPLVEVVTIDVSTDATFNARYITTDTGGNPVIQSYNNQVPIPGVPNVHDYIYALVQAGPLGARFNADYKLIYFQENGGYTNGAGGYVGLNGYSSGLNVVNFLSANDATGSHEFMHSANLPHSFSAFEASKYALYTYEPRKTDNIMDYSHTAAVPIGRVSLWQWQWKIARNASDAES